MATLNINTLASAQAIGWADARITRLAPNSVSLDGALTLTGRLKVAQTQTGAIVLNSGANSAMLYQQFNGSAAFAFGGVGAGNEAVTLDDTGVFIRSNAAFRWSSSATDSYATDVAIFRDAANTLAQRNGTAAQTKRIYGTFTDASNYRRVALAMTTAGVATLLPEGAGTGATGNVLHISGLPTSNPGAGILWNNAGTPAIGT